ncbi:unnamed protein product, partial [Porites evermanni]
QLPFAFLTSLLIGVDVACGHTVVGTGQCSLANHIKSNTRWRYVHYKDPSGNETNEAPLPLVSPYTSKSEEEINKQINRELFAHYTYLSMAAKARECDVATMIITCSPIIGQMDICLLLYCIDLSTSANCCEPSSAAMHFDRDDINLPGFHKFFKESAEEEMKHAQKLMKYQNMRGGRVKLHQIMKPCRDHWGNGLDAMKDSLALEKDEYQSLLDLHDVSQNANDPQVQNLVFCNHTHSLWCLFLETHEYANPPLPLVSPYTSKSEEEINKQINRELFAHYTYLSMVRFN